MCKFEMECNKVRCSHFHPRHAKRNTDKECKFKDECNRTDCKFTHPTKTINNDTTNKKVDVKVNTPLVEDANKKKADTKVITPVIEDTNKKEVVVPQQDSDQVFHKRTLRR